MTVTNIIYIRLKKKISTNPSTKLRLKDVAFITTTSPEKEQLENIPIYQITEKDNDYVIIDSFIIIKHLNQLFPDLEFQLLGLNETIVHVTEEKSRPSVILISFVWIVLFVGTAMTIINFHYDVSMQEVQQKIHYLFTGEKKQSPLWIQIPYSIGLGIGMILFLNKWFKKRFNEEPSPLEVEIFNYQKDLDNYITFHENELNKDDRYY
ncbi:stage V sporulation protein AA [Pseudogracilibacillus sp. SO30301A]|uniref:stage V sporulation protein AA n=1 Tax=Pseudogracilibacillus sp. SO30301A TaxID=3098291 RepID=UPI00300E3A78